jgi:hypothetical protein
VHRRQDAEAQLDAEPAQPVRRASKDDQAIQDGLMK